MEHKTLSFQEHEIFMIYDSKADVFRSPMVFQNRADAIRMFSMAANDEKTDFAKFPEDYSLFALGTIDVKKGVVTGYVAPANLGLAAGYVKKEG